MRKDWFTDLVPSPVVPGVSPAAGDASNRSAMRPSPVPPVVPGSYDESAELARPSGDLATRNDPDRYGRRPIIAYRIADCPRDLVMLGAPGESFEAAVDGLRRRYGARLVSARRHRASFRGPRP